MIRIAQIFLLQFKRYEGSILMKPMKTYTVNEIRQTLGAILKPIFTESFNAKYHDYATKYGDSPEDFISAATDNSADINILIGELVYNRHNPKLVETLIQSHSPKILSGIFLRYHVCLLYTSDAADER